MRLSELKPARNIWNAIFVNVSGNEKNKNETIVTSWIYVLQKK